MTDAAARCPAHMIQPGQGRLRHAPADHPPVAQTRVGVLIANLGTPDNYDYWSMRRYLNEFLSDKRVIDIASWKWQPLLQLIILTKRPFTSGANYKSIWNHDKGESPLMTITRDQTAALAKRMQAQFGDSVMVDFCMRYGNPSTPDVVRRMVAAGCEKILFFPLYPQYAGATTATANDRFFSALMQEKWQPAARTVPAYFDNPQYIDALAQSVERAWSALEHKPELLLASYHGMPQRYLTEGDPYHCQCQKTTRLLRERLGWDTNKLRTTFQSRFGSEEWLQPYTDKTVEALAKEGVKSIAIVNPGFSSDCIETLEEIDGEVREVFMHAGGKNFAHIPCLNDTVEGMSVIEAMVRRELQGWI